MWLWRRVCGQLLLAFLVYAKSIWFEKLCRLVTESFKMVCTSTSYGHFLFGDRLGTPKNDIEEMKIMEETQLQTRVQALGGVGIRK